MYVGELMSVQMPVFVVNSSSWALGEPGTVHATNRSGMTAMVEDVRHTLAQAGIPPQRVHANF